MPTTTVIIGAGIVGLHVAQVLSKRGHEVFVLEQAPYLADHTSGRNSGVIHAGIFYSSGSFKERMCIEGNRLTYDWLKRLQVSFEPCGKWVVPEPGQEEGLDPFFEKLRALPIPEPKRYSAEQIAKLEPKLRALPAIEVPSTGILDAAGYVKALALYLEDQGVQIILNCKVQKLGDGVLHTSRGEIPYELGINCAGLWSDQIAEQLGLEGYQIKPCRGDYYQFSRRPLKRPVYHLPYQGAAGLGVHLTPTLDGQTLVGPNAFYIEEKADYAHRSKMDAFAKAVSFYLPEEKGIQLQPAYSGNRPKLFYQDQPVGEFLVKRQGTWIHFLGIESPGLTAAPALARHLLEII